MQKSTLDLEMAKRTSFIAKHSPQGEKILILVPKPYHKDLQKFKNPLRGIVEEMETGMMSEEEFNNRDKSKD